METIFRKCVIFVVIIFVLVFASCSDDVLDPELFGTITGTVYDSADKSPLADVSVSSNPATAVVISDGSGKFSLKEVPVGTYSLTFKKNGYKNETISITVREDQSTESVVMLDKSRENNTPPSEPVYTFPANQSVEQPVSITLSWHADDADNDTLYYDVRVFESNSDYVKTFTDIRDTTVKIDNLQYRTRYFWQVTAKDNYGASTNGSISSFTTRSIPDNPFVFISNREGNTEVYSADTIPQNTVRLTNSSFRKSWPRFNPAGNRIAFVADVRGEYHIFIMERDGSNLRQLTSLPIAGYNNKGIGFCWSPDGLYILYPHYDKLYLINSDGTGLKAIATAPQGRHFRECDWSSKGDKIVALTIGTNPYDSEIYLMNPDGSNMTLFMGNLPGAMEYPSFSLDGRSVIYSHDISGYEVSSGRQLDTRVFMRKISDTTTVDLSITKSPGTNDLYPRFSRNGSRIILTGASNTGSSSDIFTIEINGELRKKVITNGEMPDWR